MKSMSKSKGFTLVEIMIVVAIIGIIIAIAVPGFIRARATSRMRACQENLTKIDGAKEQWALETNQLHGATVTAADLTTGPGAGNGILKSMPQEPSGATGGDGASGYTINAIGTDPICLTPGPYPGHSLAEVGDGVIANESGSGSGGTGS